jgi:hypothetical protein
MWTRDEDPESCFTSLFVHRSTAFHSLSEARQVLPQLRPGLARPAADEDVSMLFGLLIVDTVTVAHLTCHGALPNIRWHSAVKIPARCYLWRRVAVTAKQ